MISWINQLQYQLEQEDRIQVVLDKVSNLKDEEILKIQFRETGIR